MTNETPGELIAAGRATLGIELGSTRLKACAVGRDGEILATGTCDWENQWVDGVWTYSLEAVWSGLQHCYASLTSDAERRYGVRPTSYQALGVSAMMHGYLAFDAADQLLVPFRTWRNTSTGSAAEVLSEAFGQNIPLRWSVAHYYQAILDAEPHVPDISFLTTLAGYVHWQLSGLRVLGVGDASGMFPIDPEAVAWDSRLLGVFADVAGERAPRGGIETLLPAVLPAGRPAGELTARGASLLDPSGSLLPGVPMCPPEGDAGTGMVATNSIAPRTANVSVGTSVFAMVVLERPLQKVHRHIDLVTTPTGAPVAMVHCNNGAGELAAWVAVLLQLARSLKVDVSADDVFEKFLGAALEADADAGGVVAYNFLSAEPVAGVTSGRPLVMRGSDSSFTLGNLARAQVFSVFATLASGMQALHDEGVALDVVNAHGGVFRTAGVSQRLLAAALQAPVAVGAGAGEGGAWGMALLAGYLTQSSSLTLDEYLSTSIPEAAARAAVAPVEADIRGFSAYLERYDAGMAVERTAGDVI